MLTLRRAYIRMLYNIQAYMTGIGEMFQPAYMDCDIQ